jgi:hypothetical protein
LNSFLDKYLGLLLDGTLDEIVICDETGEDYDKICVEYKKWIYTENPKIRVFKNDTILGVFLNKRKVCSLARNRHVALIDSDNFTNKKYFQVAKKYIEDMNLIDKKYLLLCPSFAIPILHKGTDAKPFLDWREYSSMGPFTRKNIKEYFLKYFMFRVFLNSGNFILTKDVFNDVDYNENDIPYIASCDVIYFLLLAFQQLKDVEMYAVKDMEYLHSIHQDSEYLKKCHIGNDFLLDNIMPGFKKL